MNLANSLLEKSKPINPKKPDGRVTNQYGVVFFMNDGTRSTAKKLSEFYGVGINLVKKAYKENNKDFKLSNKAIEDYALKINTK